MKVAVKLIRNSIRYYWSTIKWTIKKFHTLNNPMNCEQNVSLINNCRKFGNVITFTFEKVLSRAFFKLMHPFSAESICRMRWRRLDWAVVCSTFMASSHFSLTCIFSFNFRVYDPNSFPMLKCSKFSLPALHYSEWRRIFLLALDTWVQNKIFFFWKLHVSLGDEHLIEQRFSIHFHYWVILFSEIFEFNHIWLEIRRNIVSFQI